MNKFVYCTLITLATVSLAHAEDMYVGANISMPGKGTLHYDDGSVKKDIDADKRRSALGVFAGYALSPSWALEAGYRASSGDSVFSLAQGYQIKTSTRMGYFAVRDTWKLSEDWSLYGKVGVAQGRFKAGISSKDGTADETVKKNGLYLGLGAAYAVWKDVALQLELEHTDKLKQHGLSASMDKISLGLRVGF